MPSRRALLIGSLSLAACGPRPLSYLRLPVEPDGALRQNPVIIDASRDDRQLRLIGTIHTRDPSAPSLARLEQALRSFEPDVLVHENVAPGNLTSREDAITRAGDLGLSVWVARQLGAGLVSGDLLEGEEFPLLAETLGVDAALVFLVVQRLLVGLNGNLQEAESAYAEFHREYLVANGLPDEPGHRTFAGFLSAFEGVQGYALTLETWDPELTSPLKELGALNRASRLSHRARDERLVTVLRTETARHKRVACVFGGWHVLAIQPMALSGALFG